jgi:L-2,4-diaminobutyric acid acetyltransferase
MGKKTHLVEYEENEENHVDDPAPNGMIPTGSEEGALESIELSTGLLIREPRESDAADVWRLVQDCKQLDSNSPYAYLLMCTDFSQTGLVVRKCNGARDGERAESGREGELVAFVLGYRRPTHPETLFVWQIGVAEAQRGKGMASRLLELLFDRCVDRGPGSASVEFLEATVTPSNMASRLLFTHFARDRSAHVHERVAFASSSFPKQGESPHEDEVRLRIGPLKRKTGASGKAC